MKRKYRWTLLIYDSLVYLASALLILIIYPSSIDKLTPALIVSHTIMGVGVSDCHEKLDYTGAVKPPVRKFGNRNSGRLETGMIAPECGEAA